MKEEKIGKKKDTLISLRITDELFKLLNKIAERDERSVSSLIRLAIKEYLRRLNKGGKIIR